MANKGTPVYEHALALYNELGKYARITAVHELAVRMPTPGSKTPGSPLKFEGSLVAVFRSLGISQSYYTPLFRTLKELGCIESLIAARGGGRKQSQVLLHYPPDPDDFAAAWATHLTKTKASPIMELQLQINLIERRLPDIDLAEWILSIEQRLHSLEDTLREVQRLGTATGS